MKLNSKTIILITDGSSSKPQWFLSAFQTKGYIVYPYHYRDFAPKYKFCHFFDKVFQRILNIGFFSFFFSIYVSTKLYVKRPSKLVVIKGNSVWPLVNKISSRLKIETVYILLDDMFARHNRSAIFSRSIRYVDSIYTNKSFNVAELSIWTSANIFFFHNRYSRRYHLNSDISVEGTGYDVLFIGSYESDRYEILKYLASKGIEINVFGNGWPTSHITGLNIHYTPLEGSAYINTISQAKISLSFLRKANRDVQTTRTAEIPACGGLILTEDTFEHRFLIPYSDLLFSDKYSCLKRIQKLLENTELRNELRMKTRARILEELDLSYEALVDKIFPNT